MLATLVRRLRCHGRRLRADRSGLALLEFAFVSPVLIGLGTYGIETANLAYTSLKVSQATANLADNVSRIGLLNSLGVKTLSEADINDAFSALREQSKNYGLTTYGRVILSSLETRKSGANWYQWIHWQRCIGKLNVTSSYGKAGDGSTTTTLTGMGPTGKEIKAPDASGVIFAEIVYTYQPVISNQLLGPQTIRSRAAFVVRDDRDFENNNPAASAGTTASTCSTFAA